MIRILVVLLTLFVSNAFAKNVDVNKMTQEELFKIYDKALNNSPENQIIFIPKQTLHCSGLTGFKKAYNQLLLSSGELSKGFLSSLNCSAMHGWAHGIVVSIHQDNNVYRLLYRSPFSKKNMRIRYFHASHLTTFSDMKKRELK